MISGSIVSYTALAAGAATTGLVSGLLYFAALRRAINLCGDGRRLAATALILGRLIGAIAFFGLAARLGALSLLIAFTGFLLARTLVLRAPRSLA